MYLVDIETDGYKGQLVTTHFVKVENLVKEVIEDLKLEGVIGENVNENEHVEIAGAVKYMSDFKLVHNQLDISIRDDYGNKHFIMLEISRVKVLRDPEF